MMKVQGIQCFGGRTSSEEGPAQVWISAHTLALHQSNDRTQTHPVANLGASRGPFVEN